MAIENQQEWIDLLRHTCFDGVGVEPMITNGDGAFFPFMMSSSRASGMSNYFTCQFLPVCDVASEVARDVVGDADDKAHAWHLTAKPSQIDIRAVSLHHAEMLRDVMVTEGYICETYPMYLKCFDDCATDFETYFKARPSRLKNTIKRKMKSFDPSQDFTILNAPEDVHRANDIWQDLMPKSWQGVEEKTAFIPAFIDMLFSNGWGFMSVLQHDGQNIAAQIWVHHGGEASIHKLVQDKETNKLSPGAVLTYLSIKHLYEHIDFNTIDFGRGNDAYKTEWVTQTAQYYGLRAVHPMHPAAWATLMTSILPAKIKRIFT